MASASPSVSGPVSTPPPEGLGRFLAGWSPGAEKRTCILEPAPLGALAAVLGSDPAQIAQDGMAVPPLWQWVYFADPPMLSTLGVDGHPAGGHFYPPLPERRRMFVGGRMRVTHPLVIGMTATQRTELVSSRVKQGRTGEMLFVTIRRTFEQQGREHVVEEQDIMYRSGAPTPTVTSEEEPRRELPVSTAAWQGTLSTEPTALFIFSALTSNAHRIHYDVDYARGVEGYGGLVVHGPLLVLAMLELARREAPFHAVKQVDYRLQSPVFSGDLVRVEGAPRDTGGVDLSVRSHRAAAAAVATLSFS